MDNSIPPWISGIVGVVPTVVATVVAVITAWRLVFEQKNLRRRGAKDLLELIDEAQNRFDKEKATAWRNPDAKPPRGSFEDSLAKDLLVSQIFGRAIRWSDWIEIRKFLTDHDNVRIEDLSLAWVHRDKKQAPHVCFRMTVGIRFWALWYFLIGWSSALLCSLGLMLVLVSFNPHLLLPQLLTSFGIPSDQLLPFGAKIIPLPLLLFIVNFFFFYDGYAALRICKKTESLAKQANDQDPGPLV